MSKNHQNTLAVNFPFYTILSLVLCQEWIGKSVLEDFQEDFVVDLGPEIVG